MYPAATDNRVPYWIYSNRQDDGTMRGPSTVSEQTGNGCLPEGGITPPAAAGMPARRAPLQESRRGRRRDPPAAAAAGAVAPRPLRRQAAGLRHRLVAYPAGTRRR